VWDELRFDVNFQLDQIGKSVRKMEEITAGTDLALSDEGAALAAIVVHSFYNGVESCIRLLLPPRGLSIPSGGNWHSALLDSATQGNERHPGLFSPETANALRPLLAFRHVFRHAYYFEIDANRTVKLCQHAILWWPRIRTEIEKALVE
jgi:hypothetical protein